MTFMSTATTQLWVHIRHLLEMIRFSHTLFALPFALLAAVLAWTAVDDQGGRSEFRWQVLAGILLAMVGARSAAMAFNRLVDRKIDATNPRTAQRHLPAGVLSVTEVTQFIWLSLAIYFLGMIVFLPNWLPLVLALPVLAVLLGYSYAKRFTALVHFWLGFALMLAPVCAWVAIRGEIVIQNPWDLLPALVTGGAVLFWVAGFDIIYACQDYQFDRDARLRSIPVRLGVANALRLAAGLHVLMVALLALLPLVDRWGGPHLGLGNLYGIGTAAIAGLLCYEHWIVRPNDLSRVNQAFFNVNVIVSVGLLLVATVDAVW